ncbi:MAG: hypothetical protein P8M72_07415 [Gammaproteobacteria bacterium]|nr:hypothetical protein [Gammaproteobacteria bacterium]
MTINNIHFVGSIGLEDAETVFRTLSEVIGNKATRYPDGETGKRHYWVQWQGEVFQQHPAFEFEADREKLTDTANQTKLYSLKDPDKAGELSFEPVGYAEEAISSYKIFTQLKNDGVIPEQTRFQVSIPTPVAVIMAFVSPGHRSLVEPAYTRAMEQEVHTILEKIPYHELAVQWDIAHELVAYEGNFPLPYADTFDGSIERVTNLVDQIPDDVQSGIHLCYGDPGHKHIIEPDDLGNCVKYANALQGKSKRNISYFHMPVLRERNDEAYFQALENLNINDAELVLGLIHYTDGVAGTQERMRAANKIIADYSIATECGFGRREPETILDLLKIHQEVVES